MRPLRPLAPILALAACAPPAPEPPDLPLLGGYRDAADICQRVGESPETVQYLDHTADLVACPVDYEGVGVFVAETGATSVGRLGNWGLFSVPV